MVKWLSARAIGREIRRIRDAKGLTQAQVARRAGWAKGSAWRISHYEAGKSRPQATTLRKIARGLDVSMEVFEAREPNLDPDRVGEMIRLLRTRQGWTQKDLAIHLADEDVTERVVSAWERTVTLPRLDHLRQIAELSGEPFDVFEGEPVRWLQGEEMGERLRTLRKRAGLTQAGLARAIGKPGHQQHVSRWERAAERPSLESLLLVADALGVPLNAFQQGSPPPEEVSAPPEDRPPISDDTSIAPAPSTSIGPSLSPSDETERSNPSSPTPMSEADRSASPDVDERGQFALAL